MKLIKTIRNCEGIVGDLLSFITEQAPGLLIPALIVLLFQDTLPGTSLCICLSYSILMFEYRNVSILTNLYAMHIMVIEKNQYHRTISMKAVMSLVKNYKEMVPLFKAMADETRLRIIDMLISGELCACKILESFDITQPTLSYHMKILTDSGLVDAKRDGAWMRYTLKKEAFEKVKGIFGEVCECIGMGQNTNCCCENK